MIRADRLDDLLPAIDHRGSAERGAVTSAAFGGGEVMVRADRLDDLLPAIEQHRLAERGGVTSAAPVLPCAVLEGVE